MRRLRRGLAAPFLVTVAAVAGVGDWTAPPEEKQRPNPIPSSPESIERGRALYTDLCAPCHGADGKGDPDMEKALEVEIGDLTSIPSLGARSDGELRWRIDTGSDVMPSFRGDLPDGQDWDIVNYIRTLERPAEEP